MDNTNLNEKYEYTLLENTVPVATIVYDFVFGSNDCVPYIEPNTSALSADSQQKIANVIIRPTVFTYGDSEIESMNIRTYKVGTISHFVSLVPKLKQLGYEVEMSQNIAQIYDELSADTSFL